jgi:hypothetical protein
VLAVTDYGEALHPSGLGYARISAWLWTEKEGTHQQLKVTQLHSWHGELPTNISESVSYYPTNSNDFREPPYNLSVACSLLPIQIKALRLTERSLDQVTKEG